MNALLKAITDFFKPVQTPTDTDAYIEIGHRRWEGAPAVLLFWALIVMPWMLFILALIGWLAK